MGREQLEYLCIWKDVTEMGLKEVASAAVWTQLSWIELFDQRLNLAKDHVPNIHQLSEF
jgi:hypothetical protein